MAKSALSKTIFHVVLACFLAFTFTLSLHGQATVATTTNMVATPSGDVVVGQLVSFTAGVQDTTPAPVTSGTVTFFDGATPLATLPLDGSGLATYSTGILAPGAHALAALYNGDATFITSQTASAITFNVTPRPTNTIVGLGPAAVPVGTPSTATVIVQDAATTGPAGTAGATIPSANTMATKRFGHSITRLISGDIWLVGGTDDTATPLSSTEVYHPATDSFSAGFPLPSPRSGHTATTLPDSSVVITGGDVGGTVLLFNPYDGTNAALTSLSTVRQGHTATLLPNGKIVIAGGDGGAGTVELYDPAAGGSTTPMGNLGTPRTGHTATLISATQILFIGGDAAGTAEVYDITAGATNNGGAVAAYNLTSARSGHTTVQLPDGDLLVAGGSVNGTAVNSMELFDTATAKFVAVSGVLGSARSGYTAILLDNGLVLLAGGNDATPATLNSAELLTPGYDPKGAVAVTSAEATDVIQACVLTPAGNGGSFCQPTVTPANVATSPHDILGTYSGTVIHSGSVSAPAPLTVVQATPTVTMQNVTAPYDGLPHATVGTANGVAGGALPTGTVTVVYFLSSDPGHTTPVATPVTVGTYLAVGVYPGDANYAAAFSSVDGIVTITPAALTITANSSAKTYGQAVTFAGTEFTSGALVAGDSITSVTLTSAGAAANATVTAPGPTYAITPSAAVGVGLSNYTISYADGTLTVNPAPLTVTANSSAKTYGQAVTFAGTEFTSGALVAGDSITSVTLVSAGAAANATVTAPGPTYPITASAAVGVGLGNYTISYVDGTLTVNPAPLTITANSSAKTYGQAATFAGTEFTSGALVAGDSVASVTLVSAGAAANATVTAPGPTYAITPSAAVGVGLGNYAINYVDGTLTINPAPLTVTANSSAKTYGQAVTFAGTEFTSGALVAGDSITGVTLTSAGSAVSAGVAGSPYAITPSAAVGVGVGNYTINYVDGTLTVNPAALTITANSSAKAYGQAVTFAGTEFTSGALVAGDSITGVTLTSAGSAVSAGVAGSPYAIVPSAAAGTGLSNYTISYVNGALTVNPAALTITANSTSKTYGAAVAFTGTEFTASPLVSGDSVSSVTLTSTGAAASAPISGSPYAIVASAAQGTGLANYNIAYVNGGLTVGLAHLSVTADPLAKNYGSADPTATATISGFVNGETASVVSGTPAFSIAGTAGTSRGAGSYAITPAVGTLTAANYDFTFVDGTLTVNKAPLSVSVNPSTKIYGDVDPTPVASFSGFVNGDTAAAVSGAPSLSISGTAGVTRPVGNFTVTPTAGTLTAANYTFATFTPSTLAVTPRAATVVANNSGKIYGQTVVFAGTEFTASGLVNGDQVTAATITSSGKVGTAAVGTYPITASAAQGTGASNYAFTYTDGVLTVSPATTASAVAITLVPTSGGATFQLKAAVTPTIPNTPTAPTVPSGKVTFFDGTTALTGGSVTLTAGVATFTTTAGQLATGAHSITAVYDRSDPNYAAATTTVGSPVSIAASVSTTAGAAISPISVQVNNPGTTALNLATLSCTVRSATGTAQGATCSATSNPASVPAGGTATVTINATTHSMADTTTVAQNRSRSPFAPWLGFPAVALFSMGFGTRSDKGKRILRSVLTGLGIAVLIAMLLASVGCGFHPVTANTTTTASASATPSGAYTMEVTYNNASGSTVTLATVPLTVQ